MELISQWLFEHYNELLGAMLGVLYVFFSIRQSILTWPTGLLTSALYIWVFFDSKLYAEMGLQLYYVVISIYGWYEWLKGNQSEGSKSLNVSVLTFKSGLALFAASCILFALIWLVLSNYTNSNVPVADSLITAFSIVATFMLARKILEHWIIWIFVDVFSIGLFWHKGLHATIVLFVIYTVMAFIGYVEWKKEFRKSKINEYAK